MHYHLVFPTMANLARTCTANNWYWFSDLFYWNVAKSGVTSLPATTAEKMKMQHEISNAALLLQTLFFLI